MAAAGRVGRKIAICLFIGISMTPHDGDVGGEWEFGGAFILLEIVRNYWERKNGVGLLVFGFLGLQLPLVSLFPFLGFEDDLWR